MSHVQTHEPPQASGLWGALALYGLMVAAACGGFLAIREYGERLAPPTTAAVAPHASASAPAASTHSAVFHVLLALAAMIVTGRAVGWLFQRVGQPPVIGEVLAGIMLGPSLLGAVAPQVSAFILPESAVPLLGIIAQLAVILYMFLVGLELDPGLLGGRGRTAVAISHASIVVPFLLGAGLAVPLYRSLSNSGVTFTSFSLFLGVSMSVTAFPVLARILTDRKLQSSPLGVMALTCAAADDLTAWCLLALVVGVAHAQLDGLAWVLIMSVVYIAVMFAVVRPALAALAARYRNRPMTQGTIAIVLAAVLISALITEWIGVHAIFGAFLLGAVMPHDSEVARQLPKKMQDLVVVALLPAFFALTGMRTEIGLVSGLGNWLLCGLVIAVATVGKFGGTLAAARLSGLGWRESSALGILMNTRGLMELIVLNVGLDLGVISPTLYAMLVLMALVTTIATTPMLNLVWGQRTTSV